MTACRNIEPERRVVAPLPPRPPRLSRSPLVLIARTAGAPHRWPAKWFRFVRAFLRYLDTNNISQRLARLQRHGLIDQIPTRVQLAVGAYDNLRFFLSPTAKEYYAMLGINYTFHSFLRFLEEPASMTDPLGLFTSCDDLIAHVLQVVHTNPEYDFQLIEMFDNGLEELERQTEAIMTGRHHRAAALNHIVEDLTYYQRVLDHVRVRRRCGSAPAILRANLVDGSPMVEREKVFGSLRGVMRYICTLPTEPLAALRHVVTVDSFAGHLDAPARASLVACQEEVACGA